jgi:succinate dehydrogenase / fumarate reductase flavoprotein subunit
MKILVIGNGISGMSAAIEAASLGMEVVLAAPLQPERTQSVMAAGGINAHTGEENEDSAGLHAKDTIKGGCFIEPEADVLKFCEKAPENLKWLDEMGVMFNRNADNGICVRAFGGQSRKRTAYAGASTGKQIVTALTQKCLEYEIKGAIEKRQGLYFYSSLIAENRCCGALFFEPDTGRLIPVYANAVVFATGGQNKIFGKTTGSELCDGYAAGRLFTQGVLLRNLEFIQYHPTTIETDHKRMLITEASRGEGGRLYYLKDGEKVYFMEDKYGENGNLMPRDIVSREIYNCPSQVYLDISFLGEKLIHERLEEVYQLCMDYIGLDVTKEPIPVDPSIHFFMGGIRVDSDHMTNIDCLYAVGEAASKYHGANRLGGNSLMAAVHSGRTAAQAIDRKGSVLNDEMIKDFDRYIKSEQEALDSIINSKSLFPAVYIQRNIAEIMNKDLGIVRTKSELEEGIESLDFYLKTLRSLHFDPSISVYENYRIYYMTVLAKAIMLSALEREESRGAHYRTDFPETKEEFRKCSVAEFADGEIRIRFESE